LFLPWWISSLSAMAHTISDWEAGTVEPRTWILDHALCNVRMYNRLCLIRPPDLSNGWRKIKEHASPIVWPPIVTGQTIICCHSILYLWKTTAG
jgi:hypothetical protein